MENEVGKLTEKEMQKKYYFVDNGLLNLFLMNSEITKRIDRTKNGEKIDMEDMCQLTLHPTEYKYKGSYSGFLPQLRHEVCISGTHHF